jgi:hypothetical protein
MKSALILFVKQLNEGGWTATHRADDPRTSLTNELNSFRN